MDALVTGCAGFIGSWLCERLIGDGWRVTGVDAFTDYYEPADKHANLEALRLCAVNGTPITIKGRIAAKLRAAIHHHEIPGAPRNQGVLGRPSYRSVEGAAGFWYS